MPGGVIRGRVAVLKWAYYDAATIEGYTVMPSPTNGWTATATVVSTNAYNLDAGRRAGALVFQAPIQGVAWRWPVLRYDLHDGVLRADLGPLLD